MLVELTGPHAHFLRRSKSSKPSHKLLGSALGPLGTNGDAVWEEGDLDSDSEGLGRQYRFSCVCGRSFKQGAGIAAHQRSTLCTGLAPASSSRRSMSVPPRYAASCNAVAPLSFAPSRSAPAPRSACTARRRPFLTAKAST